MCEAGANQMGGPDAAAPLPPPHAVRLTVLAPHACSYLPGRVTTVRAFAARQLDGTIYHDFMDAGFRRSGRMIYQPVCEGCRLCVPIRVPVEGFRPSKSQRRCARRNADLAVSVARPASTEEKFALYRRYVTQWHDGPGAAVADAEDERASFESFLYDSPVETLEFTYRDPAGKLLAGGIADVCARSFSSVYFYFDPDHQGRGLGTFGALHEIGWAGSVGIPHYYLGYWVHGCKKMEYKGNFRPCEVLTPAGEWAAANVDGIRDFG